MKRQFSLSNNYFFAYNYWHEFCNEGLVSSKITPEFVDTEEKKDLRGELSLYFTKKEMNIEEMKKNDIISNFILSYAFLLTKYTLNNRVMFDVDYDGGFFPFPFDFENTSVKENIHFIKKYLTSISENKGFKFKDYKKMGKKNISATKLVFDKFDVMRPNSDYYFFVFIKEKENSFQIKVNYSSGLYREKIIEDFIKTLMKVFINIHKLQEGELSSINIGSNNNLNEFHDYYELNEVHNNQYLYNLFDEIAQKRMEKVAVIYGAHSLTYGQLLEKSNNVADYLTSEDLLGNGIIGIYCDKNIEMIAVMIGIMKAGAAYLPIDTSLPEERVKYIIKDSNVKTIFTDSLCYEINDVNFLQISEVITTKKNHSITKYQSKNLDAYMIYTSGTTGRPKGVMVPHTGVINLILSFNKSMNMRSNMKMTQTASIAFDASVWEIWMCLLSGGQLHIIPKNMMTDSDKLNNYLTTKKIQVAFLPVFVAQELSEQNETLEIVITGGSDSNTKLVDKFRGKLKYVNAYGPTEASIVTSYWIADELDYRSVPIGRPVANNDVYILDSSDKPLPAGIPGELCVSGVSVTKGYYNRPKLTSEKFHLNTFGNKSLMYRTGDLARWLSDGNIDYLGRIDTQVKIRGYRIELEEIATLLRNYSAVKDVFVNVVTDEKTQYICAYVVYEDKNLYSREVLRKYLETKLPEYMIPSFYFLMEEIPLTNNGKVNQKLLPSHKKIRNIQKLKQPVSDKQEKIYKVWKTILSYDSFGTKDSFYELGGNSINSVKMIKQINQLYQTQLSVNHFLADATIEGLEKLIIASTQNFSEEILNLLRMNFPEKLFDLKKINEQTILFTNNDEEDVRKFLKCKVPVENYPMYIMKSSNNFKLTHIETDDEIDSKLRFSIIRELNQFNKSFKKLDEVKKFECSSPQNKFFKKKRFTFIPFSINLTTLNEDNIIVSIMKLLNHQEILRSTIKFDGLSYYNSIFKEIEHLNIKIIDISNFDISSQNVILNFTSNVQNKMIDKFKFKLDSPLISIIVFKLNETNYQLSFGFNHLIFDGASKNILKLKFFNILNSKKPAEYDITDSGYKKYIELEKKYSTSCKSKEFIMSKWYKELDKLLPQSKIVIKEELVEYFFEYPINNENSIEDQALAVSLDIGEIIFQRNNLAVRVTRNSRIHQNNIWNNTVGDFHISLPLILDANKSGKWNNNKVEKCYDETYNNNVFVDSLAFGTGYLSEKIVEIYDKLDFGFNFIGNCDETEYQHEKEKKLKIHDRYFITAFTYKGKLCFIIRLPKNNGKVIKKVEKYFENKGEIY